MRSFLKCLIIIVAIGLISCNNDESSFDVSETGFEWSKVMPGRNNYEKSREYCEKLQEGGRSDWRLPTISELRKLIKECPNTETEGKCKVEDDCLSEACKTKECTGCEISNPHDGNYSKLGDKVGMWSISEVEDDPESAWGIYFYSGEIHHIIKGYTHKLARCVADIK